MRPHRELIWTIAAAALLAAGCSKKAASTAPPPPTPAPAAAPSRAQAAEPPVRPLTSRATEPAPAQPSRYPDAATRARIDELLARIQDAYFDYDKHTLRPDALTALASDSRELRDILVQYPDYKLTIEGYCDERGSDEYNLALGDARAKSARDYLVGVGIPDAQFKIISFGKQRQICDDHTEACWQKNRRIHIVAMAVNN